VVGEAGGQKDKKGRKLGKEAFASSGISEDVQLKVVEVEGWRTSSCDRFSSTRTGMCSHLSLTTVWQT